MPRRVGGFGACKCCRCEDCCSGSAPYAFYVEIAGTTDATCDFCDEAFEGTWYIPPNGAIETCWWQDEFGDTLYWTYADVCEGTVVYDGVEYPWRLRVFHFFIAIRIECIDDGTYGVTVTINQEWFSDGYDPVDCCGPLTSFGDRRAISTYYLEVPRGSGECAAWSELVLPRQDTVYEYRDTTDPFNPTWVPMTPTPYSPCQFPSSITLTSENAV